MTPLNGTTKAYNININNNNNNSFYNTNNGTHYRYDNYHNVAQAKPRSAYPGRNSRLLEPKQGIFC